MLPEPALSFTIPSLHDGTTLDCRVYHPASLAAANAQAPAWQRHAAVVAHPYAPMGGCFDDPILECVVAKLLKTGYLVGTFNFRGAGHSAGRTSWTARPERDDYATVVGFMVHYIHYLDPFAPPKPDTHEASCTDKAEPAQHTPVHGTPVPVLLMGGYSYGAMLTAQIPPLGQLLEPFARPRAASHAAQVRLRAQHLAEQQNLVLGSTRSAVLRMQDAQDAHGTARRTRGVRVGGDESGRSSPRKSHDASRRTSGSDADDKFRRVHDFVAKHPHLQWHHHRRSTSSEAARYARGAAPRADEADAAAEEEEEEFLPGIEDLLRPRPAYLLVSPLQGLVTRLATMSLLSSRARLDDAAQEKLVRNPTLAVFGDRDVFVSVDKLRVWTERLRGWHGSLFTALEVHTGGHFWGEEGVLQVMIEKVGVFAERVRREGEGGVGK